MANLQAVPTPTNAPEDWKRLSTIKHLATLGAEFQFTQTMPHIDREACMGALLDVIAREADKLETSLDSQEKI